MTTIEPASAPIFTAPFLALDNFLPGELALGMRRDIEAHFANPHAHTHAHQVWNYWFVPTLYTYLRTSPEKVIERQKVEQFTTALRAWAARTLGLHAVTWPFLSLYVSGCKQGLHNDSKNGRFGFVYSLTKNERKSSGGETVVMKEGDLFRDHVNSSNAGPGFFTAIEPRFNRLVIFDDRMPHAVERVDGSMDPVEGRFVLHGHIGDGGPVVYGPLKPEETKEVLMQAVVAFLDEAFARVRLYHGPVVLRLDIAPDGKVISCWPMLDRVTGVDRSDVEWLRLREQLLEKFRALKFPEAAGPSVVTMPMQFDAALFRPKIERPK